MPSQFGYFQKSPFGYNRQSPFGYYGSGGMANLWALDATTGALLWAAEVGNTTAFTTGSYPIFQIAGNSVGDVIATTYFGPTVGPVGDMVAVWIWDKTGHLKKTLTVNDLRLGTYWVGGVAYGGYDYGALAVAIDDDDNMYFGDAGSFSTPVNLVCKINADYSFGWNGPQSGSGFGWGGVTQLFWLNGGLYWSSQSYTYIGGGGNNIGQLDLSDGSVIWGKQINGSTFGTPWTYNSTSGLAFDGTNLLAGMSWDNQNTSAADLGVFNPSDGTPGTPIGPHYWGSDITGVGALDGVFTGAVGVVSDGAGNYYTTGIQGVNIASYPYAAYGVRPYWIDAYNGTTLLWRHQLGTIKMQGYYGLASQFLTPSISPDGTVVYVPGQTGASDYGPIGAIYAINTSDGSLKWFWNGNNYPNANVVYDLGYIMCTGISKDGTIVYLGAAIGSF